MIIRKHIPRQSDIDKIVKKYRNTCDTRTGITNPGTRSYSSLPNIGTFSDIYHYITDGKLPSGSKAQNCIHAEALNYVVVSNFLFRIDTQKDKDRDKGNLFLLVIPEKYEPIIFHTYHDSLLAGHII